MYDWQVHIEQDWQRPDGAKLTIYRRTSPGHLDVLTSVDERLEGIYTRFTEGTSMGDVALRLPYSALKAIAETIKPGPAQGEVAALKEALTLERERVDRLLGRAIIAT